MNQRLAAIYEKTIERYQADARILGAWEFGSLGKGTGDEYSDVDPVFIVRDDAFDQLDAELRPLFESFGVRIALWWPEGFNDSGIKNYAILFDAAGELLQYDMTIASASSVRDGFGKVLLTRSGNVQVLFDKEGLIRDVQRANPPDDYSPAKLVWDIERYWIYVYIHIKYLKRGDLFKLLYAQETLFHNHLDVLHALHPSGYWGWWPWYVKNALSKDEQAHLLVYFNPPDREVLAAALRKEIDLFARDAREACRAWKLDYPAAVESDVRTCLAKQLSSTF
jgi:predicted nucleotidyltransferase